MLVMEQLVDAEAYDSWYRTPRGAWIGETEFRLLRALLRPERGETLLDAGCGTGYFTRRFAGECGLKVVGLDPDSAWLDFARTQGAATEQYCLGSAESLPFADRSFDCTVSVTALCFIDDARRAVQEILRVTRKRFAIGLLNRRSLLYLRKGRYGGLGAYRGAHWHTAREIRALFNGLPAANLTFRGAVFLPEGGAISRWVERVLSQRPLLGAFLVVAGDVGVAG
ncbi:MAG: methyltransferase domain-containing protein [Betaproteobacteria bacterium]